WPMAGVLFALPVTQAVSCRRFMRYERRHTSLSADGQTRRICNMSGTTERESMEFDVVIVGAGPAGLAAAIRLKQLNADLSVVVLEKGAEVGAHILSGAVVDPIGIDRLIPEWR